MAGWVGEWGVGHGAGIVGGKREPPLISSGPRRMCRIPSYTHIPAHLHTYAHVHTYMHTLTDIHTWQTLHTSIDAHEEWGRRAGARS